MSFSNLTSICRLCLSDDDNLSVFDNNYTYLQQKILACLNIEVREFDKISTTICRNCHQKIEEWYEYRNQCQRSQFTLMSWLYSNGQLSNQTSPVKIEINEDAHFENIQIKEEPLEPLEYVNVEDDGTESSYYSHTQPISIDTFNMIEADNYLLPTSECSPQDHGMVINPEMCNICFKNFSSVHCRIRHEKTVHRSHRYIPSPVQIKEESSQKKNPKSKDDEPTFKCKYCTKTFSSLAAKVTHEKRGHDIEGGSAEYSKTIVRCQYCKKGFFNITKKIQHENTCEEKNLFSCKYCTKKFMTVGGMLRHQNNVHKLQKKKDEKNYPCRFCKKQFLFDDNRIKHEKFAHKSQVNQKGESPVKTEDSLENEKVYPCPFCPRTFKSAKLKCDHERYHLKYKSKTLKNKKRIEEVIQLTQFTIETEDDYFNFHKNFSQSMKTLTCFCCNIKFQYDKLLKQHLAKIFLKYVYYNCYKCYAAFDTKSQQMHHRLNRICDKRSYEIENGHLSTKIYQNLQCRLCDYILVNDEEYELHLKRHETLLNKCPHCPLTFKTITSYHDHLYTSCIKKIYCAICKKHFNSQSKFDDHCHVHYKEDDLPFNDKVSSLLNNYLEPSYTSKEKRGRKGKRNAKLVNHQLDNRSIQTKQKRRKVLDPSFEPETVQMRSKRNKIRNPFNGELKETCSFRSRPKREAVILNGGLKVNGLINSNINEVNQELTNSELVNSTLTNSEFVNSTLTNSEFVNSTLTNSEFVNSTLTNSVLANSALINSTLTNSELADSALINSTLTNSTLTNSTLTNSELANSALINSMLTNSTLALESTKVEMNGLDSDVEVELNSELVESKKSLRQIRIKKRSSSQSDDEFEPKLKNGRLNSRVKYFCSLCKKGFDSKQLRLKHLYLVHNDKAVCVCIFCDRDDLRKFVLKDEFEEHSNKFHKDLADKKFSCNLCGALFSTLDEWKNHQKEHTKNNLTLKIVRCQDSNSYKTENFQTLDSYDCQSCQKSFKYRVDYEEHNREVHPPKRRGRPSSVDSYDCQSCQKTFKYRVDYEKHNRETHPKRIGRPSSVDSYDCESCQESFKYRFDYEKHNRETHPKKIGRPSSVDSYDCQSCEKSFKYRVDYEEHNRETHPKRRGRRPSVTPTVSRDQSAPNSPPKKCPNCGAATKGKSSLYFHLKRCKQRQGEPDLTKDSYECHSCQESFERLVDLEKHNQVHHTAVFTSGDNDFGCHSCEKTFQKLSDLDNHSREEHSVIQSGEVAKSSVECSKTFKKMSMYPKDEFGRYKCARCPESFERLKDYREHFREVHRSDKAKNSRRSSSKIDSYNEAQLQRNYSPKKCPNCSIVITKTSLFFHLKRCKPHLHKSMPDLIDSNETTSVPPFLQNMSQCPKCSFSSPDSKVLDLHLNKCEMDSLNKSMPDLTSFDDDLDLSQKFSDLRKKSPRSRTMSLGTYEIQDRDKCNDDFEDARSEC